MKVRSSFVLVVLAVIVLLVASCAAPAAPTAVPPTAVPAAPTAAPAEEPTAVPQQAPAGAETITYWRSLTGASGDAQDELVRRFNESQSDVFVDVQFQGAYAELMQKLLAGLVAGEVPDLVLLDSPFMVLFAKDGALVPLDVFAQDPDKGLDVGRFIPGLIQDGYYDGSLYALPMMRSTPLLYYNADMFEEVGLPDRVPETWDEFKEFCAKLSKVENGEPVRWGVSFTMGQTSAHWYFQGAVYAFGGEVSDADFNILLTEPEAKAAAQLWQDLVFTEKTAIPGIEDAQGDFLNGRVGMVFGSTGSMANLMSKATFRLGAGFMPAQARRMVPVGGSVIAMTSTDEARQAATWEFMKWVTSPESNAYVVEATGYMPTGPASTEVPSLKAYYEQHPERTVAVEQLQYARPQASVISLGKGTAILKTMIEKLLVAGTPVDQVMEETAAELRIEYEESFK
ncbi:MAG TPA: ABC transporter substrate-binding protein [Anaerolineae bacterium]|nr:ABC transporter substrate-binding protein [Anaerolineae bacterium]